MKTQQMQLVTSASSSTWRHGRITVGYLHREEGHARFCWSLGDEEVADLPAAARLSEAREAADHMDGCGIEIQGVGADDAAGCSVSPRRSLPLPNAGPFAAWRRP
jgi:hypothetical protein